MSDHPYEACFHKFAQMNTRMGLVYVGGLQFHVMVVLKFLVNHLDNHRLFEQLLTNKLTLAISTFVIMEINL